MKRKALMTALLGMALLLPIASAQTIGTPSINDLFLDIGAAGAPVGPPFGAPCGAVPPLITPFGVPFTVNVTTPVPGLRVLVFANLTPCLPGAFCLPPVFGPYAVIPPCLPPCGPGTNQSIDLTAGTGVLLAGFAGPSPFGPGGQYTSPVFVIPGAGILISLQAVFFDPAGGGVLSMVMTNAVDLII